MKKLISLCAALMLALACMPAATQEEKLTEGMGVLRDMMPTSEEEGPSPLEQAGIAPQNWDEIIEFERGLRWGKKQKPGFACIWLPKKSEKIQGLFWPGGVAIDRALATRGSLREALAELNMGVLYGPIGFGEDLNKTLRRLGKMTGHPELEYAPFFTAGHSSAGIFSRNIGYEIPDRVIGMAMIKSGNFHHGIPNINRTLAGIPLIHIVGEFEEYGPEGGDMGAGLRSAYLTLPKNAGPGARRKNQTQWVMTRMQMIERRRKNLDNIWTLVVHRNGGHMGWDDRVEELLTDYIRACFKARVPENPPAGQIVKCKPLTAKDGWLYDADIKNTQHEPAPWADYTGDKTLAFWAPDQRMAQIIYNYHMKRPWSYPDPTEGKPYEERWAPPELLKDYVDTEIPGPQKWNGGSGPVVKESSQWEGGAFDAKRQMSFTNKGDVLDIQESMSALGLIIGDGVTLNLGQNRISGKLAGSIGKGSTITLEMHERSPASAGKRGSYVSLGGDVELSGTLIVKKPDNMILGRRKELPDGHIGIGPNLYGLVHVKGKRTGDFEKIVVPEGATARWVGNVLCLDVPKLLSDREQRNERNKKEKEYKERGIDGDIDRIFDDFD